MRLPGKGFPWKKAVMSRERALLGNGRSYPGNDVSPIGLLEVARLAGGSGWCSRACVLNGMPASLADSAMSSSLCSLPSNCCFRGFQVRFPWKVAKRDSPIDS